MTVPQLLALMYNAFNLIPWWLVPIVPIVGRTSVAIAFPLSYFFFLHLVENSSTQSDETIQSSASVNNCKEKNISLNFTKGMHRLIFPVYLTNYLVIRYLFFSSRTPITVGFLNSLTRILSTSILILLFALLVQLFILSPVEYARQRCMTYLMREKTKQEWADSRRRCSLNIFIYVTCEKYMAIFGVSSWCWCEGTWQRGRLSWGWCWWWWFFGGWRICTVGTFCASLCTDLLTCERCLNG